MLPSTRFWRRIPPGFSPSGTEAQNGCQLAFCHWQPFFPAIRISFRSLRFPLKVITCSPSAFGIGPLRARDKTDSRRVPSASCGCPSTEGLCPETMPGGPLEGSGLPCPAAGGSFQIRAAGRRNSHRSAQGHSTPAAGVSSRRRWFSFSTFRRNSRSVMARLMTMGIHKYMMCSMLRQSAL